jgi:uncharacterized protein (TIGR03067 family)
MESDLQQLQGTWQAVRIESQGNPVPAETARRLKYVFAGDRVTLVEDGNAVGTGSVMLDPGAAPKAITVRMEDGPGKGQTASGIYRVARDTLTLCIGGERPSEFSGTGAAALIELEREKS